MSATPPARRRAAAVKVGVGTRFTYDGETVTMIEMFPAGHGNEVLVEDRGGKRRYWLALRELLASEHASIITDIQVREQTTRSTSPASCLANLTTRQLAKVTEQARHVREVSDRFSIGAPARSVSRANRERSIRPNFRRGSGTVAKARRAWSEEADCRTLGACLP